MIKRNHASALNCDRASGDRSSGRRTARIVLGAFLGALVLPAAGWTANSLSDNGAAPAATPASTHSAMRAGKGSVRGVDGLIAHLHSELQITAAQETAFQGLADVMREDADSMRALSKARAEAAGSMTAVDDLKSYAEISEAHADGAKKMVPAFQALYDSLSDAQKKLADEEFREHYSPHRHHHMAARTAS